MRIRILAAVIVCASACQGRGLAPVDDQDVKADEKTTVKLCDNHTTVDIPADMAKTKQNGQAVADALMSQWKERHPDAQWEDDVRRSHPNIPPPADNKAVLAEGTQGDGHVYGRFTEKDVVTWSRESEKLVLEGARVFHDAEALGSTIAVSCDMCHPDAANTHPETYPKFQTQLGRVALMRDMINWCLEHPVRAPAMQPDDPRMRAMEAYILAQRKGVELEYGKH
jgi:cytochrome c